jgi:hypothetical protein
MEFISSYPGDISTQAAAAEEIVKEGYAIRDNSYRIFAFTRRLGAKRIA